MNPLQEFYRNVGQREAFKAFQLECLKEMAVERAFDKAGDCIGIAEGKECVDRTFQRLEERFGKKEEQIITNAR